MDSRAPEVLLRFRQSPSAKSIPMKDAILVLTA